MRVKIAELLSGVYGRRLNQVSGEVLQREDEGCIGERRLRGFLGEIPPDLRERLLRGASSVTYERGARIGDTAWARPGVVVGGLVRAYVDSEDGREATLKYLRRGDAIGIGESLVEDWPCSFQALEATTILYFDGRQFEAALANDASLARIVAKNLARRLAGSSDTVRQFAFGRVRQRVATHLISLATPDGNGRMTARVTQQELADAVGSVRDVVARSMAELSSAGLVVTSHGKVVITDEDALLDAAEIV